MAYRLLLFSTMYLVVTSLSKTEHTSLRVFSIRVTQSWPGHLLDFGHYGMVYLKTSGGWSRRCGWRRRRWCAGDSVTPGKWTAVHSLVYYFFELKNIILKTKRTNHWHSLLSVISILIRVVTLFSPNKVTTELITIFIIIFIKINKRLITIKSLRWI